MFAPEIFVVIQCLHLCVPAIVRQCHRRYVFTLLVRLFVHGSVCP